jgi:ankyrin repeat protein
MASLHDNSEVVKALLNKGANVNAKTISGYTALMTASGEGNSEVMKALFFIREFL